MAYAERELDPEEWATALFKNRPPQRSEIASCLAGAIERGRRQEREACVSALMVMKEVCCTSPISDVARTLDAAILEIKKRAFSAPAIEQG